MATGARLVELGRKHVGEKYVLGAMVPKDNPNWKGPWDCAEFLSWLVFQASGRLYGCARNDLAPAKADAYTGFWKRDAMNMGRRIDVALAVATPGAFFLRFPPEAGVPGHIALSDGAGGTIEAKGAKFGVVADTAHGRPWDIGVLVPWIEYTSGAPVPVSSPGKLLRLGDSGVPVRRLQQALRARGIDPGVVDGIFGDHTLSAVASFQRMEGLVVDGIVGRDTATALGL